MHVCIKVLVLINTYHHQSELSVVNWVFPSWHRKELVVPKNHLLMNLMSLKAVASFFKEQACTCQLWEPNRTPVDSIKISSPLQPGQEDKGIRYCKVDWNVKIPIVLSHNSNRLHICTLMRWLNWLLSNSPKLKVALRLPHGESIRVKSRS